MSGFGGWMEGLAPLIQNVSDRIGSGAANRHQQQREQRAEDEYRASTIPKMEIMSRVEGAKAAGIHPLAALGVNVGNYSSPVQSSGADVSYAMGSYSRGQDRAVNHRVQEAQIKEIQANARRATADADLAEISVNQARANLATQPGNAPYVELQPNRVTRSIPGQPGDVGGLAPSQQKFAVYDSWTGQPRTVTMPDQAFGGGVENLGELWQAALGTPYALDVLYQKYLQTPREWLSDALLRGHIAGNRAAAKMRARQDKFYRR